MRRLVLTIDGMSCGHCLAAVNRSLAVIPGVQLDSVQIGRADLQYDDSLTDLTRISTAVQGAGYHVAAADEVLS